MEIIPAIDLLDHNVVRLYQGDFNKKTIYSANPIELVKKWESLGINRVHIVDLEGARYGKFTNINVIEQICKLSTLDVEVGGGIRNRDVAHSLIDAGVDTVIVGTIAIRDKEEVLTIAQEIGASRVAIALDARNDKVAVDGWENNTETTISNIIHDYQKYNINKYIYTDIDKDGTEEGPNRLKLIELLNTKNIELIASGGIGSIQDIENLSSLSLFGLIIGKALYSGTVDISEAIKLTKKGY
ncbi:MAG: 1-(5-phosphoribosyl)-5-[(5-phosphoribosylamino)methylideneamino]imidazole-4-carboxamide isomerase [SAR202 cluster bacterium]|nr:1-(5-phosphoribosyl)-5-[(5-phosphoribosylamino)methylideneamino]imidazole-4-carboxamide isomerase [Chloroflexota bacterium]MQG50940.1 1-(5-phosphoribosyl)-5-[(5-phosphoribosylamino)methylideneamino]imidazole-4-carboxamide isomerase [SAR202 cluster bacterium]|tara:strand:- start:9253 stop:9978 length:726 start_codon:yes stop_codon:yes gene_type:complete